MIKDICCNYDDTWCVVLDCTCPQINCPSLMCRHCIDVLLEDDEYKALKSNIFKNGTFRKCANCGKKFIGSGRAKYCCDKCKKEGANKKHRDYMREHRK